jgi:hypothetical protein
MKTSTLLWDTSQYSLVLICNAILAGKEVQQQVWKSFQLSPYFTVIHECTCEAVQVRNRKNELSLQQKSLQASFIGAGLFISFTCILSLSRNVEICAWGKGHMSIKYYYSLISFFIPIHKLVLFNSKNSSYYFFKVTYQVVFSWDQY